MPCSTFVFLNVHSILMQVLTKNEVNQGHIFSEPIKENKSITYMRKENFNIDKILKIY